MALVDTPEPATADETVSAAIRRRLEAGEWLNAELISAEYGVSRSLLAVILSEYRKTGRKTRSGGKKRAGDSRYRNYIQLIPKGVKKGAMTDTALKLAGKAQREKVIEMARAVTAPASTKKTRTPAKKTPTKRAGGTPKGAAAEAGFTLAGHLRDRFQAGETVEVAKVARELGLDYNRVRHAVGNLRHAGLAIERVGKVGQGKYQLDPAPSYIPAPGPDAPDAPDAPNASEVESEGYSDPDDGLSPRARRRVKVTEAPMLGARLKVVALALERGDVVVRLEGDGEAWTAVLRK